MWYTHKISISPLTPCGLVFFLLQDLGTRANAKSNKDVCVCVCVCVCVFVLVVIITQFVYLGLFTERMATSLTPALALSLTQSGDVDVGMFQSQILKFLWIKNKSRFIQLQGILSGGCCDFIPAPDAPSARCRPGFDPVSQPHTRGVAPGIIS